ncbi:MAG TPA: FTR1 family protein [Gemmatimonadaceae bacterium]|nr:FTR1 family protein [Gemmatimonadaceae bacterium]
MTTASRPTIAGGRALRIGGQIAVWTGAAIVLAVLIWSAIVSGGAPDPTALDSPSTVKALDIAVLVFREGLECILVLAAITASMKGSTQSYQRPVAVGAALAFAATLITWFAVVGMVDALSGRLPALDVQAATGLLAVIVLLVVMNWFFHKVYWTGWISMHNRRKRTLMSGAGSAEEKARRVLFGLGVLGFTSLYREGFEVVLFLQSYRLRMGGSVVLAGVAAGLALTAIVAVLTFIAHRKLPYRRMLVFTGIMLGVVLLVMVGEQAQEMQLAHWLPTTIIPWLEHRIPAWMGLWFSVFPTVETLVAQGLAALIVIGSYFIARRDTSHSTLITPDEAPAVQPSAVV